MPVSYRFVRIKEFNNKQSHYEPMQLTLENLEEEAECKYSKSSKHEFQLLKRNLNINDPLLIDTLKKDNNNIIPFIPEQLNMIPYEGYIDLVVNKKGKVFNSVFYKYLEPNEFLFYHLKELNKIEVDFSYLQSLIPVITGALYV